MNLDEVETGTGKKYVVDHEDGHQYYATALEKNDQQVLVKLGNRVGNEGEAVHALGTLQSRWVDPKLLHEF